jgi:hypothetical protein
VIEIGCLEIEDFIPTGRTFHRYIKPGPGDRGGRGAGARHQQRHGGRQAALP